MAYGVVIAAAGVRADDLMDLSFVEVQEQIGKPTTFYLRYPVLNDEGDLFPLKEARLAPGADLAVFQRSEDFNDCLVKGQVFSHQIHLVHGVEGSTLEVVGADAMLQMDRETKITQWADNTRDSDAVTSILGSYGLTPDVDTTNSVHLESKRTLIQHDTDLNFVRKLARRNGCLFWVRADETLIETAYFKPPPMDPSGAPLIRINIENPNVTAFDIAWDVERPTSVIARAYDGAGKTTFDGGSGTPPPATFDGDIPLSSIAGAPRSTSLIAAVTDAGDLMGRASGVLMESSWFVQATCVASIRDLGQVVHVPMVVNVDGVGTRYSGSYLAAAVHHVITADDHRMTLTLVRNGWKA